MRRWDLVQKVTVAVMGAAIVLIELMWGHLANPVLLMLGVMMLGLPAFLHYESKRQPAKVAGVKRDLVKPSPAVLGPGEKAVPLVRGLTMAQAAENLRRNLGAPEAPAPCGYCSVLKRPCACRRSKPTWTPPADPNCARGHHEASTTSSTCVRCGVNLFDHSMLFA